MITCRLYVLYASCADELKSSELYRNDLIEFVSYYLAAKAENFYKQALKDDSGESCFRSAT